MSMIGTKARFASGGERDVWGDRTHRDQLRIDAAKRCDEPCEILRELIDPSCSDMRQRRRRVRVDDRDARHGATIR
jgi:hypothetical protein